jgi:L-ascorbate metabolism protein UlaG (beta-lactamase superfamily)
MKISKYGHACLLVEEGDAKILIDPGAFSKGFEKLTGINAILITHQHPDHMVPDNIEAVMAENPTAEVYSDEGSAEVLTQAGIARRVIHEGDEFDVNGVKVEVFGRDHAVIHPDIPGISNVGYMIAKRFFYPGDAFTIPGGPIEILAAPVGAPWLKIEEAVDYVRDVKPKFVIPVHDGVLSDAGMQIQSGALKNLGGADKLLVIEDGERTDV